MAVKHLLLNSMLLFFVFGLTGCVSTRVPYAAAPDPKVIADIPPGRTISLINAQPSTELVQITEPDVGYDLRGNLHLWTDQIIDALTSTLGEKKVTVSERSTKSLKVAITKSVIELSGGGWVFHCVVNFTVQLGDGPVIPLISDRYDWKWMNACDGAMASVSLMILEDARVLKYLAAP